MSLFLYVKVMFGRESSSRGTIGTICWISKCRGFSVRYVFSSAIVLLIEAACLASLSTSLFHRESLCALTFLRVGCDVNWLK